MKDKVSPCNRYGFALQKIWFCLAKDKVSQDERYGFIDWEINFGLLKKQKIGLSYTDFVIYLYIKWLQKYNPHWNLHWNPHWTRTGTRTEKYCFGIPADWLWFHKIQVMMTRMKRTTCMVWWIFLRFQLQRYNKKTPFPNFGEYLPPILRQSVIHVNRWRHCGASEQEATLSCWRDSYNDSCQSCSSWKNLRERCVLRG